MIKAARPTGLKAIADRANVSVSLVSKVLNGRLGNSRVSPDTIAVIQSAARSLDYRKNYAAAALVSGRQNVIGGFVHDIGVESSGIAEQLVRGMAAGAARHGRRLMLRFFQTSDQFLACMPEISPALLDGLIVAGIRHPELTEKLRDIQASGVSVITVHEEPESPANESFTNIYVDQVKLCEMATEHLISRGCRRIAHIHMKPMRAEGYARALRKHGRSVDPELIYHANSFRYPAGIEAIRHFAAKGIEFDGLVAQSDEQATGAMDMLLRAGKQIPQDVKIIGIDNSPLCNIALTPLSSMSGEFYAQGVLAVDLLADRVEGKPVRSVGVEPVLYARDSTLSVAPAAVRELPIQKAHTFHGEFTSSRS